LLPFFGYIQALSAVVAYVTTFGSDSNYWSFSHLLVHAYAHALVRQQSFWSHWFGNDAPRPPSLDVSDPTLPKHPWSPQK